MGYSGHLRDALKELDRNVAQQFASKGIALNWKTEGISAPISLGSMPVLLHNLDEISIGLDNSNKGLVRDIVEQEVKRFLNERYNIILKPQELMKI